MGKRIKVRIQQLEEAKDLILPKYMSEQAAGMDLYANVVNDEIIEKGKIKLISTGIKIALPDGYEAQIRPRSGLALKHGISLVNTPGTIDADYRGEIKVIMINFGDEDFIIKRGERIAQMVINKIEQIEWEVTTELEETGRGSGGFGHTGV
ncbi:dUTP pyrophosphatase [Natranaerovirga pectinivora]|uniref:Deoxyuridine 5'-triphosphate nucleotidohydrolase n=1 Tax=Natranaerovirga pectinivora TaxID=682400 RepID=A0A4R3MKQ1_9FIRM|nr:dUTP diphosphatase [Natranaerovirga pectinivora]TCT15043.1 dUTP pyrophosphatase [Natranaerovirga pectinivora]